MNLEKAIEILELNIIEAGSKMPPDVKTALTIGVAAIEREQEHRDLDIDTRLPLLTGETKE